MFSVIMRNPKFCNPFLEWILCIKIFHIEYLKPKETIDIFADVKSVRQDIHLEEGKEIIYNFENHCIQNPYFDLGDDTTKIILNTKGTMDDLHQK